VREAPVATYRIIAHRAVQQATIVPHHHVTLAPAMRIDPVRLGREVEEQVNRRALVDKDNGMK